MRIADWLTYTGIEQLKELNRFYGLTANHHSKHDLICTLLRQISHKRTLQQMMDSLSESDHRFLQSILLDPNVAFTIEELLGRGRMALRGRDDESPRSLVVRAMKRAWLFPGFSAKNRGLYHVPTDLKMKLIEHLRAPFLNDVLYEDPDYYRDEMNLLQHDFIQFLLFTQREIVRLTKDGAIFRQQQKKLFQTFAVITEPLNREGPRFGFGRSYHLYPDRFSLIYDYAFYQGYIIEQEDGILCLTKEGQGKCSGTSEQQSQELYRFWIRLYRRPIETLPMILRWIGLLAQKRWISLEQVYQAIRPWITSYYNETEESLYQKVVKMLLHLGVIQIGKKSEKSYLMLTELGEKWLRVISGFDEQLIEKDFYRG